MNRSEYDFYVFIGNHVRQLAPLEIDALRDYEESCFEERYQARRKVEDDATLHPDERRS